MPKRNIHLDAELSDDRDNFEPEPEPVTAPAPAPAREVAAITQMAQAAPPGTDFSAVVQALADAMRGAIQASRPPMREVESEQRSVYNPEGNTQPRPTLDCETFIGMLHEDQPHLPPSPLYDYDEAQCTNDEIRALNRIPAGEFTIRMYDGIQEPVRVHVVHDPITKQPLRKIIALRKHTFDKARRNLIPNVVLMADQIAPVAV